MISYSEGHIASSSEGEFLRIWGFEDTLHYVWEDTFQNMIDKNFKTNSDLLTLQCFCNIPEGNVVMHKIGKGSIDSATTGGG